MGTNEITGQLSGARLRAFNKQLLNDLHTLDQMIRDGILDGTTRCIGAEQEVFLVDRRWRPAPMADEVLSRLDDGRYTTELARFNLEFNLDPEPFGGRCLRNLETQIEELLAKARTAAKDLGVDVVLCGILPTLSKSDLGLENMTDRERYRALNQAMTSLRGTDYHFRIRGLDELEFKHSSVMLESCNTSMQIHFQVGAQEFAPLYNLAQTVTAPVLAAAVNSPLLFGKRLWSETRIALFQQSVDTRATTEHLREMSPRVSFGHGWLKESVLEIYREDVSRFKSLLGTDVEENSWEVYASGQIPRLRAMQLNNSTVYRWNRPCYGINPDGSPHLRIENRALPAGPSIVDELANAALWFGLMSALSKSHEDITQIMNFDDAHANFLSAARLGLDANFVWFGGKHVAARDLLREELIPIAREGLKDANIDERDVSRYLDVLHDRVENRQTGAKWMVDSLAAIKGDGTRGEQFGALTAATRERQQDNTPVHTWPLAKLSEAGGWKLNFSRVEQYMTTELFTVQEDEVVDLVASMMHWKHIRHVPVEDSEQRLVGLVSYRTLLRHLAVGMTNGAAEPVAVSEVMERNLVTVPPETPTMEAIQTMREHRISCLPVVKNDRLVGIVSEHDFIAVAGQLLDEFLAND